MVGDAMLLEGDLEESAPVGEIGGVEREHDGDVVVDEDSGQMRGLHTMLCQLAWNCNLTSVHSYTCIRNTV